MTLDPETTEGPTGENGDQDDEDLLDDVVIEWDEQESELPPVLQKLWQGTSQKERKLDVRATLEQVPKFKTLPLAAPKNNFRQLAGNRLDQLHRTWSQTMLHNLRMQATALGALEEIDNTDLLEPLILLQKSWQLQAELYHKVTDHRREMSIQGSTQSQETDFLFGKEEISNAKLTQRINQGVRFVSFSTSPTNSFRFRKNRRPGPFRGAGKPMGKAVKPYGGMSQSSRPDKPTLSTGNFFGVRQPVKRL